MASYASRVGPHGFSLDAPQIESPKRRHAVHQMARMVTALAVGPEAVTEELDNGSATCELFVSGASGR